MMNEILYHCASRAMQGFMQSAETDGIKKSYENRGINFLGG